MRRRRIPLVADAGARPCSSSSSSCNSSASIAAERRGLPRLADKAHDVARRVLLLLQPLPLLPLPQVEGQPLDGRRRRRERRRALLVLMLLILLLLAPRVGQRPRPRVGPHRRVHRRRRQAEAAAAAAGAEPHELGAERRDRGPER